MSDSHGGYFADGVAEVPLVDGVASAVVYADGTIDVASWGTEVSMTPEVVAVRQNMALLVDEGELNPDVSSEPYGFWGVTWPGGPLTLRTSLGVTSDGAELFGGGAGVSVPQLAQAMLEAGAVRAMELDQNSTYPNFSIFTPPLNEPASPASGAEVIPGFSSPERYFDPSWNRDFFAIFARSSATGASTGNGAALGRRVPRAP